MLRREFIAAAAAPLLSAQTKPQVMTVTGSADPAKLGIALPHEHLFSNFGADPAERAEYDERALLAAVVPYVESLKRLGCGCIADATAAWFGRHPVLLRTISRKTGVRVITNTGYYGAANDRYVPKHAFAETAEQLAARWTAEWKNGIDGTGIRPGFLKIGVDAAPLSQIDRKLIRAAAVCHKATGLTIAVHTGGDAGAASEQIAILKREGVSPRAWIWVHANGVKDPATLVEAAKEGAWIELDGIEPASVDRHLELVRLLREQNLLNRILLSHDGNSFRCCDRPMKPYDSLFTHFIPRLRQSGFTDGEIRTLTVVNPANALTIQRRTI
jgi:phosphotriesterase-related protein